MSESKHTPKLNACLCGNAHILIEVPSGMPHYWHARCTCCGRTTPHVLECSRDNALPDIIEDWNRQTAAPDYHKACTCGAQINLPDFLDWLADRLVNVYGESPNVDFVHTCRDRAKALRAAIAKAKGRSVNQ